MSSTTPETARKARPGSANKLATLSAVLPGLRYLSLGVLTGWAALILDLGNWMSGHADVSAGGLIVYLVCGVTLLGAAFARNTVRSFSVLSAAPVIIAVVGVLGALLLIASNLAFSPLSNMAQIAFFSGAVMCGISYALMTLRIAALYCELKPNKVLLYSLVSDMFVAVLFFIVTGTSGYATAGNQPSFGFRATMVLAPAVAMFLASLPKPVDMRNEEQEFDEGFSEIPIRSFLSAVPTMIKLLISILIFTIAASFVTNCFMVNLAIDSYQINVIRNMLFRLVLALCLLIISILYEQTFSLNKLFHFDMLMLVFIIALISLVGLKSGVLFSLTIALANLFALVVWCLLTFVTKAVGVRSNMVFGLGMGCLYLGRAMGYMFKNLGILDTVEATGTLSLPMVVILLLMVVICVSILFTEKDFDAMLEVSGATDINVRAALKSNQTDKIDKNDRPWHKACCIVSDRAVLSEREQELMEALSRNQTPQEIAANLHISVATVRTHTHNIYVKLDVHSREELIDLVRKEYETLEQ